MNRQKLLSSAAEEFARAGLQQANINEISLAAGLAKGTVYNYFTSKEALFAAVVEHACELAAEGAESTPETATTAERLQALITADMQWVQDHEPFAKVLVRELLAGDASSYRRIVEAGAPYTAQVLQILQDGVARGEVRPDFPLPQLALIFVGLGDLALVQHWGSGGGWPSLEDIPDLVVRQFLEGAAPRG